MKTRSVKQGSDIYEIVDSAVLSDIIKGYTQKACNAAGLSDAQTENVLVALDSVLDSVSAKDVVK